MTYRYAAKFAFLLLSLLCVTATDVRAQNGPTLSNLPPNEGNDRFSEDVVDGVAHPSLSLNGFDCGSNCTEGLGLKQVLEEVYSSNPDESVEDVYNRIVGIATGEDPNLTFSPDASSESEINDNMEIAQARGFVALATYVLARNGYDPQALDPDLPTAATAAARFKAALRPAAWGVVRDYDGDGVHWTVVAAGMARAMDLYLALENAYCHYGAQGHAPSQAECTGASSSRLFSESEKANVFGHYTSELYELENSKNWDVPEAVSGTRYYTDPGNWPLKLQTTLGYAALAAQSGSESTLSGYLLRALKANFKSGGERGLYWSYQTDDGKRFWAEGAYYFKYALTHVVPFWRTIRINDMLDLHPDFNAPDPFRTGRFTQPLDWLADIATPDGRTPPLDDGNKVDIDNAGIMRWTGAYGDASLGRKYAWISDQHGFGSKEDLLTVEIAIPRVSEGQGEAPARYIGNASAGQTGENGEQQVVLRRKDGLGQTHYVLLNGESGDAYTRGEGHEQPDNMQLLYYVGDTSFLMDTGYDSSHFSFPTLVNGFQDVDSEWNNYYEHNVLHGIGSTGALPDPYFDLSETRMKINAYDASHLYYTQHGSVDVLHGKQYLPHAIVGDLGSLLHARAYRDVLFVGGSNPYLIDFNRAKHNHSRSGLRSTDRQFNISYYGNSNSLMLPSDYAPGHEEFIRWVNVGGSRRDLYVYPVSVEYPVKALDNNDVVAKQDDAREKFGAENQASIKRIDIKDYKWVGDGMMDHFSVASIIQARASGPSFSPELIWSYAGDLESKQGWVWKRNSNTYDVFVGRSTRTGNASRPVRFSLRKANGSFPDFYLNLPGGDHFGFARLEQDEDGDWQVNPAYQVNLQKASPPPLGSSITFSGRQAPGETLVFDASASGGPQSEPHTFEWKQAYIPNANYSSFIPPGTEFTTLVERTKYSSTDSYTDALGGSPGDLFGYRVVIERGSMSTTATQPVVVVHDATDGEDCTPANPCDCPPGELCLASVETTEPSGGKTQSTGSLMTQVADSTESDSTESPMPPAGLTAGGQTAAQLPDGRWLIAASDVPADSLRAFVRRIETGKLGIAVASEDDGANAAATSAEPGLSQSRALPAEFALQGSYPNPARQKVQVVFDLPEKAPVEAVLYDALGRQVQRRTKSAMAAGRRRQITFDVSGLSSGVYVFRLRAGEATATGKVVVVK